MLVFFMGSSSPRPESFIPCRLERSRKVKQVQDFCKVGGGPRGREVLKGSFCPVPADGSLYREDSLWKLGTWKFWILFQV